jgi:hypothetical protein
MEIKAATWNGEGKNADAVCDSWCSGNMIFHYILIHL